jgi:hypothetical protein
MTLLPFPIYFSINRQQLLCFKDENPRKHTVYFRNCLLREDAIYWAFPILLTVKVTVMSSEVLNNVHTETVSRSWRKTAPPTRTKALQCWHCFEPNPCPCWVVCYNMGQSCETSATEYVLLKVQHVYKGFTSIIWILIPLFVQPTIFRCSED